MRVATPAKAVPPIKSVLLLSSGIEGNSKHIGEMGVQEFSSRIERTAQVCELGKVRIESFQIFALQAVVFAPMGAAAIHFENWFELAEEIIIGFVDCRMDRDGYSGATKERAKPGIVGSGKPDLHGKEDVLSLIHHFDDLPQGLETIVPREVILHFVELYRAGRGQELEGGITDIFNRAAGKSRLRNAFTEPGPPPEFIP